MLMIRFPREEDWAFWHALDPLLPFDRFLRVLRDHQGYVLLWDDQPAAVLRFTYFLERTPLGMPPRCDTRFDGKALDTALLSWWEQDMLQRGHDRLLLAVPREEAPDRFWALGWREAGALSGEDLPDVRFLTRKLEPGCACEAARPAP